MDSLSTLQLTLIIVAVMALVPVGQLINVASAATAAAFEAPVFLIGSAIGVLMSVLGGLGTAAMVVYGIVAVVKLALAHAS